ncbi:NifB/NifX family molybdenum-iron cluster-binding protein [Ancylomarina longa]|uniref:Dinitrogenase iron-molybdenum cofactor biosynthesis domain-containing protein n=1 Tax=Ancylomarina longa TaxID=2487017 RepID=A0A434AZE6_9BACT|nr:NifB/NifX family molybdenum-iron cluster-binding protein [Ancylomarina longa]RUT80002.1 hypothetical protein DLK05_01205 [Ancylomarina longa]
MKRLAIPIAEGKLSEFFGQCSYFEIFEIDKAYVKSSRIDFPQLKDIIQLPEWIASIGITDVVTFKIDKRIVNLFGNHKINLFIGIRKITSNEIIKKYLEGTLISDESIISEITSERE